MALFKVVVEFVVDDKGMGFEKRFEEFAEFVHTQVYMQDESLEGSLTSHYNMDGTPLSGDPDEQPFRSSIPGWDVVTV